ncbi:MAG: HAMP domain-containing sensor histidine kinase [Myxococcota bacterium]
MSLLDSLVDMLTNPASVEDRPHRPVPEGALERWHAAVVRSALDQGARVSWGRRALVLDPAQLRRRLESCWDWLGHVLGAAVPAAEQLEMMDEVTDDTLSFSVTVHTAVIETMAQILAGWAPWSPEEYLVAVGAMSRDGRRLPLGELLLSLGPREQIVALLVAETHQAIGLRDANRYTASLLRWLLSNREWSTNQSDPDPLPSLERLVAFGLVTTLPDGRACVVAERHGWLEEVVADPPSPLATLVRATLADRVGAVITARTGVAPPLSTAAVRDLAETVAHELGNLVPTLRLSLGELSTSVPDADPRLLRLQRVTDQLADFASNVRQLVPAGHEPPQPLRLMDLVNDVVRDTVAERNGHLHIKLDLEELEVQAPPTRLRLALVQLVRNAAQAARGSERRVTLRVTARADGERVSVEFTDDGPGVPEHLADRIFTRGVSGRGGSGIGLALVHEVVVGELGGSVHHERPAGGGARFVVKFERERS